MIVTRMDVNAQAVIPTEVLETLGTL